MKRYNEMSIQELEEANQVLMAQKEKIQEEQKVLVSILDKRVMEQEIQRKIGILSDEEKAFLHQTVTNAGGIKSEEKVGGLLRKILRG